MSLVNTLMVNMRVRSMLDKWELRASRYGALDLFMMESNNPMGILSTELRQRAEQSIGRTIQVPVIDYDGSVSIGSSRSITISDDENTSQLATFSFTTYSWGFTMVPAMYTNNDVAYQEDFDRKFRKYWVAFADALDTACITALESAKTQVLGDDLGGKYTLTSNIVPASLAQQDEIIGDLNPLMKANDFYDTLHIVGNPALESLIRNRLLERGQFNEVDKAYQYNDKVFHFTNNLTNAASIKATGIAVNEGSTGLLFRFERESVLGTTSRTGHEWDIVTLPGLGIPVGTYYYESVGDYNAIAGAATADLTRAKKEHFGFAVDVATVTAYNSDQSTIASPIMKFTVATS